MKESRICYWCPKEGCTELTEVCMMAAIDAGDLEAAAVYEALSNESSNCGCNLDVRKLRILMDCGKKDDRN